MNKKWALFAGAAIGASALLPGAAQAQGRGPFADVPTTHWAYEAVSQLANRGIFTGYPDGTFSGRRALTRYEFAVALQRMLAEVQRLIDAAPKGSGPAGERGPAGAPGAPGPVGPAGPGVPKEVIDEQNRQLGLLRSDVTALQKLAQEFSSELAMLGTDVEQLKRNVLALADRVGRVETTLARMPKITGAANIGFRAASSTGSIPGYEQTAVGVGIGGLASVLPGNLGVTDRDGRLLNNSSSMLERVNAFYDIDLGITANISDVATARLLLNAGNYLRGYLGNRVSSVNPFIDGGAEGVNSNPSFTVEDVVPYYLYLETPIKLGGAGVQLTVGKFGHQFTPYTLKMVDVDSYFQNDKTDLGDYPITGARANLHALGLDFSVYGGVHQNEYSQLTSTAGFISPGSYISGNLVGAGLALPFSVFDVARFQPQGSFGHTALGFGSTLLEQSAGVRANYTGKRISIGGTYLVAGGSTSNTPGATGGAGLGAATHDVFRQLNVMGVDVGVRLFKNLEFSGAVTQSRWDGQFEENTQKFLGIDENNRRAWDLRVKLPLGGARLAAFYKKIGDGFDAPGSWGKIGNWYNPRGIEGFGGEGELPIGNRLTLAMETGAYNYRALDRAGLPGSDLIHLRGDLRFKLSRKNTLSLGAEYVRYDPEQAGGVNRTERYYNAGWAHQFNPNMSFRLMYQFLNVDQQGVFESPRFDYEANIIATQFQVRF
jgi:predicted porin